MSESAKYFEGVSRLHDTLRELRLRLDALNISYAVVGGMALTIHGYARMTEDVDVLIAPSDLKRLHKELVGRGYKREFEGGKNLRDTNTNVKIEFVLTGAYEPIEHGGVKYIGLTGLVELKLASGMTGGAERAKDLVDVQQLIITQRLERAFEDKLHAYVRAKYTELWDGLRATATSKRFVRRWNELEGAASELRRMQADGVVLEPSTSAGYARIVTNDPDIARKYEMHEESEFFGDGDE